MAENPELPIIFYNFNKTEQEKLKKIVKDEGFSKYCNTVYSIEEFDKRFGMLANLLNVTNLEVLINVIEGSFEGVKKVVQELQIPKKTKEIFSDSIKVEMYIKRKK